MEARRDAELAAPLPHRIVVVRAVDPDHVEPLGELGRVRLLLGDGGHRPAHEAAEHHHLVAELARRVVQLLDRLRGRVHRDDRGRHDPVRVLAELVGGEHVVGAADRAAQPRVLHTMEREPGGRIHDAQVDAELVQPLVHEPWHHRGRAIEHVFARRGPERFLAHPAPAPLGERHLERVGDALGGGVEAFDRGRAADAAELLLHDGPVFDPVAVGVDDRVVEAGAKLSGLGRTVGEHGHPQARSIGVLAVAE